MNAEGSQLAQVRPGVTTAVTAYSNPVPPSGRGMNAEVTLIVIANTTASPAKASVFHHNAGATHDQSHALFYQKTIPANDTMIIAIPSPNSGIAVKPGGTIGVQTDTASALTFSLYGVTQQVPTR